MNEYEIMVETINPCGGEGHAKKEIIEAACANPEAYAREKSPYPIMDITPLPGGDTVVVTGDGKGNMVRYTFTEL